MLLCYIYNLLRIFVFDRQMKPMNVCRTNAISRLVYLALAQLARCKFGYKALLARCKLVYIVTQDLHWRDCSSSPDPSTGGQGKE